jgi:hypothetical protein
MARSTGSGTWCVRPTGIVKVHGKDEARPGLVPRHSRRQIKARRASDPARNLSSMLLMTRWPKYHANKKCTRRRRSSSLRRSRAPRPRSIRRQSARSHWNLILSLSKSNGPPLSRRSSKPCEHRRKRNEARAVRPRSTGIKFSTLPQRLGPRATHTRASLRASIYRRSN